MLKVQECVTFFASAKRLAGHLRTAQVASFTEALSVPSVSYTHLDVYKRQLRLRCSTRGFEGENIGANDPARSIKHGFEAECHNALGRL